MDRTLYLISFYENSYRVVQILAAGTAKRKLERLKDFNFQLHYRLSKFEVPVVVNLKHIFELFGLYTTCFLIQKLLELIRLSSDGQFWRKSQNKKGGKFELRSQLCYYNCIVYNIPYLLFDYWPSQAVLLYDDRLLQQLQLSTTLRAPSHSAVGKKHKK